MNALLKKEIRLLLPGWLAILFLEVLQPWCWREADYTFGMAPVVLFFGLIIYAVDSFGREFSLGTFQSLLAQPVERRQIWRAKITGLFGGALLIFAAYFVSCELRFHHGLKNSLWPVNPAIIKGEFLNSMTASVAVLFVALTGGLWTSLLLRQISSAFWITFLAPAGVLVAIVLFMSHFFNSTSDTVAVAVLYGAAVIYSGVGFWLAHRLFMRAQDVAWTGGVISFSKWRYFEGSSKSAVSTRHWRPFGALMKKEFQLQSISLFCACVLLELHIGVLILRAYYTSYHKGSFADGVSEFFWMLWLVMPLVIGGTTVAEERKLGVTEQQFCLPVSRRTQFTLKFIPTMLSGVLLGGVMPLWLETMAAHFGAPSDFFKPANHAGNDFASGLAWFHISIVALSAGLSFVAFFASTLARNFLQALSIAIVTIVGCFFFWSFITYFSEQPISIFGILPWPSALPVLIAIPTTFILCLWLVYRNFCHLLESGRLWRRNILGVIGALLFILVSSALIYNRVWDMFKPVEPAHGPAIFSLSNPPKLYTEFDGLLVHLPDGRFWFDSRKDFYQENHPGIWKQFWRFLNRLWPESAGPQQFIDGSNWVSMTAKRIYSMPSDEVRANGYLDTVGVKSNGTLWISSKSVPEVWTGNELVQFGDETNWLQVTRSYGASFGNFMLLKNNGTLWRWGNTNHFDWGQLRTKWPSARTFTPRQFGTNSDWKEIFNGWTANARKTDGSAWIVAVDSKTGVDIFERQTNYDQVPSKTFSWAGENQAAYIGNDGSLWICNRSAPTADGGSWQGTGFLRVGNEVNWVAVGMTRNTMVALKSDGSLWKWNLSQKSTAETAKNPPARLGIHNDWVGLTGTWDGTISLAADGSLWFWPGPDYFQEALLKAPKQPYLLGNVFGKAD